MKKQLLLLFYLFTYSFAQSQNLELVWGDEFDYTGLPNSTKWSYDVGGGGWGNSELQYYTENRTENARVENGNLIIEARKESFGGMNYTSARLVTRNKGDWKYAKIEVRAKVAGGRGSWPAIWMLPTNWEYGSWPASGEIDIMEYVGYDPTKIHGTVHTKAFNHSIGTQVGLSYALSDAATAFHVYSMNWTETKIELFVDNVKYFTFNSNADWEKWPFDKTFHLLLNVAVGGNWGGAQGVDDAIFPTRMEVDYVRVYKEASPVEIVGNEFVSPNQTGLTYAVGNIVGGSYEWTVPADAQITTGQGTNSITVNWGAGDGEVKLLFSKDNVPTNYSKQVKVVQVPEGNGMVLADFEDKSIQNITASSNTANTFIFSAADRSLKVKYNVQNAAAPPYFELEFERPIDMSNHPEFAFDMKTKNLSNSVIVRADLVDVNGRKTDYTPVYNIYSVNKDGNFHTYSRDFNTHWITNEPYSGVVDKSRIKKVIFYVNYGFYGINNRQDSVWFDNVQVRKSTVGIENLDFDQTLFKVFPNPVQDFIQIEIAENIENQLIEVSLLSIEGKQILLKQFNEKMIEINTESLNSGIYFLKLKYKEKLYVKKIVKH